MEGLIVVKFIFYAAVILGALVLVLMADEKRRQ